MSDISFSYTWKPDCFDLVGFGNQGFSWMLTAEALYWKYSYISKDHKLSSTQPSFIQKNIYAMFVVNTYWIYHWEGRDEIT